MRSTTRADVLPEPNWPPSWTRAALELCVLSVVGSAEATHGYDVARRLQDGGLGDIKGGTLYPVLARLEEQGLTRSWWVQGAGGPGRKMIEITASGAAVLTERFAQWRDWSGRVDALLDGQRRPTPLSAAEPDHRDNDHHDNDHHDHQEA